jgi:hypothetical protein
MEEGKVVGLMLLSAVLKTVNLACLLADGDEILRRPNGVGAGMRRIRRNRGLGQHRWRH